MRIICLRLVKSIGMDCVLWNGCGRRILGCPKASCPRRWLRQGRGKASSSMGGVPELREGLKQKYSMLF